MDWFQATILGIVQGLTEFLPVSSTAHVMLTGRLFFGNDPQVAFSAVIQIGTALAVLIYFIKDIWRIIKAWFLSLIGKVPRSDPDARMGWFVIVGTIPVAVLGLAFQNAISSSLRNLWVTVAMLLVVGIVLWVADAHTARLAAQNNGDALAQARRGWVDDGAASQIPEEDQPTTVLPIYADGQRRAIPEPPVVASKLRTLDRMTWTHAIIFGVAQAAALIPGVSRSGATTSAGLFLGYDRPSAARYSFLLSIPAVWASGLFELKGIGSESVAWGPTLLATGIAFVVGFAVIAWLLRFISTHTFRAFAIYRIVIALVVAGLLISGVLAA